MAGRRGGQFMPLRVAAIFVARLVLGVGAGRRGPIARTLAAMLAVLALAAAAGCSPQDHGRLFPDERPSVELTNAPIAADRSNPYFYAYRVNWSGNDPDGRVDHYDYAIDPTATDTTWITTTKNEQILFFRATQPDPIHGNDPTTASDFH